MGWKDIFLKNLEELIDNKNPHYHLQPRHPAGGPQGGQWKGSAAYYDMKEMDVTGETKSVYKDVGQGAVPGEYGRKRVSLYDRVKMYEDVIRDKSTEHSAFFDNNGNVLLYKKGTESAVYFTENEISRIRGNIAVMTHNHPRETSFSVDDIKFAINNNIGEIRVVSSHFTYTMKSSDNWKSYKPGSKKYATLIDHYNETNRIVYERFSAEINAGRLTPAMADLTHQHEILSRLSREYNFTYSREMNT